MGKYHFGISATFYILFALFILSTQLHEITILSKFTLIYVRRLSTAQNSFSFEICPLKMLVVLPCNEKVSGSLCELCKINDIVGSSFAVHINGSFRSHKSNIGFSGNNGSHCFIGSKSGDKCEVDVFIFEVSFLNRHI